MADLEMIAVSAGLGAERIRIAAIDGPDVDAVVVESALDNVDDFLVEIFGFEKTLKFRGQFIEQS
jgi:hypothetical protein